MHAGGPVKAGRERAQAATMAPARRRRAARLKPAQAPAAQQARGRGVARQGGVRGAAELAGPRAHAAERDDGALGPLRIAERDLLLADAQLVEVERLVAGLRLAKLQPEVPPQGVAAPAEREGHRGGRALVKA